MRGEGIQTTVLKYICLMPIFICKLISSVILYLLSEVDVFSRWLTARKQIIFTVQLKWSYAAILNSRI